MKESLKVAIVGPKQSGKSAIANLLADFAANCGSAYRPTKSVRILELERQNLDVQLWDCAGDLKLTAALNRSVQAALLVVQATGDINADQLWNEWRQKISALSADSQWLLIVVKPSKSAAKLKPPKSKNLKLVQISFDDEQSFEQCKKEFDMFLHQAYQEILKQRDAQEQRIMG